METYQAPSVACHLSHAHNVSGKAKHSIKVRSIGLVAIVVNLVAQQPSLSVLILQPVLAPAVVAHDHLGHVKPRLDIAGFAL